MTITVESEDGMAAALEMLRLRHALPTQQELDAARAYAVSQGATDDLDEWDAGDDSEIPPPRGWLLGNVFCRGFMSSLLGDGATGKTALRIAQLMSLAIGRSLTGDHVFQRCRVLIVSFEDDERELKRKVLAARIHHDVQREELKGWLFLSTPGAGVGKLMTTEKYGRLVRGSLAQHLEDAIVARKIDVVSLDPFVKTHSVDENNNSAIDDVVQIMTDLAAKYDIAIDAPHHTSKGTAEPGNASRGRGASAMNNAGRLVYTLATMSEDEAKDFNVSDQDRKSYVRMDSGKVNTTKASATAKWFRLIGVRLGNATELYPNGDEVQTVEVWRPPETWADLSAEAINDILDRIHIGLGGGNYYSDAAKAGDREAWKAVTKFAPKKTEKQAREIIRTWVKNGVLAPFDYVNPDTRKKVSGLKVDPDKRPSSKTPARPPAQPIDPEEIPF
jgi:AAA domain